LILSIDGVAQKMPVFVGNENVLIEGNITKTRQIVRIFQQLT
jgi:hypothetical protein